MKSSNYLYFLLLAGSVVFGLESCGPHYVATAPAQPVIVRPVQPYPGAVWRDGGWRYRRGNYTYYDGNWERPRRTYYSGQWRQEPRGYRWVNGGSRRGGVGVGVGIR